jgi:hypothetical protein
MPAKDVYHDSVKQALINDGWTILKENYELEYGQGKRILSITRGFSTADSALLLFIEKGFSTCSALIST